MAGLKCEGHEEQRGYYCVLLWSNEDATVCERAWPWEFLVCLIPLSRAREDRASLDTTWTCGGFSMIDGRDLFGRCVYSWTTDCLELMRRRGMDLRCSSLFTTATSCGKNDPTMALLQARLAASLPHRFVSSTANHLCPTSPTSQKPHRRFAGTRAAVAREKKARQRHPRPSRGRAEQMRTVPLSKSELSSSHADRFWTAVGQQRLVWPPRCTHVLD